MKSVTRRTPGRIRRGKILRFSVLIRSSGPLTTYSAACASAGLTMVQGAAQQHRSGIGRAVYQNVPFASLRLPI